MKKEAEPPFRLRVRSFSSERVSEEDHRVHFSAGRWVLLGRISLQSPICSLLRKEPVTSSQKGRKVANRFCLICKFILIFATRSDLWLPGFKRQRRDRASGRFYFHFCSNELPAVFCPVTVSQSAKRVLFCCFFSLGARAFSWNTPNRSDWSVFNLMRVCRDIFCESLFCVHRMELNNATTPQGVYSEATGAENCFLNIH